MTKTFHPAAEIFPLIEGAEFESLVEDIRKQGLINDILLHPDGSILDGRNRYRACLAADVKPRFKDWDGIGSAADFVWSLNDQRRHLDGNQRKMTAGRYAIELEREAKERAGSRTDLTSSQNCDGVDFGRSSEKAAEKFNESPRTIQSAVKIVKDGAEELVKAVESGDVSVSAAAVVASLPKEEQIELVARGEKEILAKAKEIRQKKAAARKAELSAVKAIMPAIPSDKYDVIIIDPPWEMQKIERDVRPEQVAFDYPTMSEDELSAFDVDSMAAENCHMFCWTTHKHLPMAVRLLNKWGFRYVLTMVWHKPGGFQPVGLPQYNCEFAIYARKGSPKFIDTKAFPVCFDAPRREHSRKPDEFYDVISRVTEGRRIDVFSREKRTGFDQFGNEVEKFVA